MMELLSKFVSHFFTALFFLGGVGTMFVIILAARSIFSVMFQKEVLPGTDVEKDAAPQASDSWQ